MTFPLDAATTNVLAGDPQPQAAAPTPNVPSSPQPLQLQNPQVQPPAPDQTHNALGRAVRHVASALEGNEISYVPDPTTGAYKEVVSPRKPGQIWRDILLGSIIGGAAGAQGDPRQGIVGGVVRGGAAELQAQQQQDSKAKSRALELGGYQKGAKDTAGAKKMADDLAAGSIATHTMSALDFDHHANLHNAQQIDDHNRATDVMLRVAEDNGANTPQIMGPSGDLNGKPDNGGELMKMFQQNPEAVMRAPEGFHRTPFVSVDTSGLKYEGGKWVDSNGKEVDLADHTTFTLVDIPTAVWNKQITATKGDINAVGRRKMMEGNSTDSATTTFGQMFGLGLKAMKEDSAERQEMMRPAKDEKEAAGWVAALKDLPTDATPEEKASAEQKAKKGQDFLDAVSGQSRAKKGPTSTSDRLETRALEGKLADGSITADQRKDLIQREQETATKGVPDDIVAAIGQKPVPAQFTRGKDDPQYRAALKLWGNASLNKKSALQAAAGLSRYQMLGEIRDYNVTNTGSTPIQTSTGTINPGETARVTANDARRLPPQVILNTQDGTKIMSKQAALGDIQYNIDNTKEKIGALDNLDLGTRAKLAVALRSPDPASALNTLQTSEARAFADPKLQDAMIALTSMAENVMLLRSVQGVGGAGSDMMRHALVDLIPSAASPNKGYAVKQLDVLQRTLNQLKKGIPSTGGASNSTNQSGAPKPDYIFVPGKGLVPANK